MKMICSQCKTPIIHARRGELLDDEPVWRYIVSLVGHDKGTASLVPTYELHNCKEES